jgi:CRISPR type I-E-associated protein CasB/Cse2
MNNSNTTPKERAARFVGRLRSIRKDRGQLAALRRGFSNSTVMDAWPVVVSLGGDIGQPGESIFVDVAALFASHPEESNTRNFGEACRAIALADSSDHSLPESYERRFRRLLACGDMADLSGQLRSWIRLASSKGVVVNYESLFADLWNWRLFADDIRVKWAKAFWQSGETSIPETIKQSNVA